MTRGRKAMTDDFEDQGFNLHHRPDLLCPVCAGRCDPAANGMSQIEHDAKLPEDWSQSV
jgi:hypothetical protein